MKKKGGILMLYVMVKSRWVLASILTPRSGLWEGRKNRIHFTAKKN